MRSQPVLGRLGRLADQYLLLGYAALVVIYLLLPISVLVMFSFNDPAGKSNFVWQGFTLDWYLRLLGDTQVLAALRNSLLVALCATLLNSGEGFPNNPAASIANPTHPRTRRLPLPSCVKPIGCSARGRGG